MFEAVNNFLQHVDDLVWGVPLIVAILLTGIYLTIRLKGIQITNLPNALKYMFENEESGHGEVTSFGALCTALSATIGTGNIVGVATAMVSGGPGALVWNFSDIDNALMAFPNLICMLLLRGEIDKDVKEFKPGASYNVYITIYGFEKIEVTAVLTAWENGGDIDADIEDGK